MKEIQQLIKKDSQVGGYNNIFPKTFTDAITDKSSGITLTEILSSFNMYFLTYTGSKEETRLQVPMAIRKQGLWITYVLYNNTIVIEYYDAQAIDDDSFKDDKNWRVGSNTLVGDISISVDGYWVINGEVSTIKAQGEPGTSPSLRYINLELQTTYDGGKTWSTLTKFENKLFIKGWVANTASLPTDAVQGDIYGVGPNYDSSDPSHTNPYYLIFVKDSTGWVNNGRFTSVSAGVVQETGTSEADVMSQKAVTDELTALKAEDELNESYTNVGKDFTGTDNTLVSTALKVPSSRRGLNTLISNYISEYATFTLRVQSSAQFDRTLNIVLDNKQYPINIVKGDTNLVIANKINSVSYTNYTTSLNNNTITFTRTIKGIGDLKVETVTTPTVYKVDTTWQLIAQGAGSIKITVNGATATINILETDDFNAILKKILLQNISNTGVEQLTDNSIRFTNYNTTVSTPDKSYTIDGGGIVSVTQEVVQEFSYTPTDVTYTITTIYTGSSSNVASIYHQLNSLTTDENARLSTTFSKILDDVDKKDIINNIYSYISPDLNSVPAGKQVAGCVSRNFDTSGNPYLGIFVGGSSAEFYNRTRWSWFNKNVKQLTFTSGIANWYPKKDSYGNYTKSFDWVFEVIKPLETSNFYNVEPNYKPVKIIIPVGTYTVSDTNLATIPSLWWNIVLNKIEYGAPSNYDTCFLISAIGENYNTIHNMNGFQGIALIKQFNTSGLQPVPISKGVDYIDVSRVLPDDFSNIDIFSYLGNALYNIKTWYFPKGEYKTSNIWLIPPSPGGYNFENSTGFKIIGSGIDSTIIKLWDFDKNTDTARTYANYFNNVDYKNLTIRNQGFSHYGGASKDGSNDYTTLENVKIEFTLSQTSGHILYAISKNFHLNLKNVEISVKGDAQVYSGMSLTSTNLVIEGATVGDNLSKPFDGRALNSPIVKNLHTKNGVTGIFFGANKESPLDHALIEGCIAEGAQEECLSFDTFGNNVGLNPVIAELSIKEGVIETIGSGSYINRRLKLYCDARRIVGSHPNEYYQAYTFSGNEDYLNQFYVVFSSYSGSVFAGLVAKIIEVGEDATKGQYVVINTQLSPTELTLLPDTDLNTDNNSNYQVASIMSGFFNCVIRDNIIRGGRSTGLALYQSFFNSTVSGNRVENCTNGSYLFAGRVLAKSTWNPANNNIITNNIFSDCNTPAFSFTKYGSISGYNNIFTNNIILNSTGIVVQNEEGLVYEGNSIIGKDSILNLKGTNNTNIFGIKYPIAPYPGQEFFDTSLSVKKMWNGTEWVNS